MSHRLSPGIGFFPWPALRVPMACDSFFLKKKVRIAMQTMVHSPKSSFFLNITAASFCLEIYETA